VNDENIANSLIDNGSDENLITRNELYNFILKEKLENTNTDSVIVLNLDIDILNRKKIIFSEKKITEIDTNLFSALASLKEIDFSINKIQEIHPNIFNGLVSLEEINFRWNQIKEIHSDIFDGLANLWIS
jgi:hypothetical protein